MKIGILSFQGDVIEHACAIEMLGEQHHFVRSTSDLDQVDGLIIPGGESTVISKFLEKSGVGDRIISRCQKESFPVYGTCAGAIICATEVLCDGKSDLRIRPLGLIDIIVERNAYGRQTESFETDIESSIDDANISLHGVFIRAPKIIKTASDVEILVEHQNDPVLCRQGNVLVSTFHPELNTERSVTHELFLSMLYS